MTGAPLGLAVIGHVNHGKTALVRALTGVETDRLREEIERGLSITLGFAWRAYPEGQVEVIDAPGHEDFIRAMVMGAAGARAALLVVSATEGVAKQTREHLRIAQHLGLSVGVVAVTKADLLEDGDAGAVLAEVAEAVAGTFLEGEPVVLCSAVSGLGIETLHAELGRLAGRAPPPQVLLGAFLPLDRVFTVAGTGAVGTGTLQGGALRTGEEAVLLPSGVRIGLRQVQVHGQAVERAPPGGRAAVAMRGVSASEVEAGEAICAPGAFEASRLVDVEITLAADSARPLRSNDEVRAMWGARQDMAKVRLLGTNAVAPGERALAQLRFPAPTVAFAGQRAVLRRPSPAETIAGVVVLDPIAPALRGKVEERRALLQATLDEDLDGIAAELARRDGALCVAEAARLGRLGAAEVRARLAGRYAALDENLMARAEAVAQVRDAYLQRLGQAHAEAPTRAWAAVGPLRGELARSATRALVAHVERALAAEGAIRLSGAQVALPGHDPLAALAPASLARLRRIEAAFLAGGMTPPTITALDDPSPEDADLAALLVDLGRLVSLRNHALRQTLVFHAEALEAAGRALRTAFPPPTAFATGEAREALATSRKFIVPALEYLDARCVTVREGDARRLVETPLENSSNPF